MDPRLTQRTPYLPRVHHRSVSSLASSPESLTGEIETKQRDDPFSTAQLTFYLPCHTQKLVPCHIEKLNCKPSQTQRPVLSEINFAVKPPERVAAEAPAVATIWAGARSQERMACATVTREAEVLAALEQAEPAVAWLQEALAAAKSLEWVVA